MAAWRCWARRSKRAPTPRGDSCSLGCRRRRAWCASPPTSMVTARPTASGSSPSDTSTRGPAETSRWETWCSEGTGGSRAGCYGRTSGPTATSLRPHAPPRHSSLRPVSCFVPLLRGAEDACAIFLVIFTTRHGPDDFALAAARRRKAQDRVPGGSRGARYRPVSTKPGELQSAFQRGNNDGTNVVFDRGRRRVSTYCCVPAGVAETRITLHDRP